jgi:hypothetical protein
MSVPLPISFELMNGFSLKLGMYIMPPEVSQFRAPILEYIRFLAYFHYFEK